MADFADVVEEIKNTNKKLDVLTQTSDPSGASATEEKRDAALQNELKVGYLKTIAESVTGYKAGAGGAGSKEDEKTGGIFAGLGRAFGSLSSGVGRGIGGFMGGVAKAAAAAAAFPVVMTALGAGIAGFLGAFAVIAGGALWVVSKMMPGIADGLKEFDDVDGNNLRKVGWGMSALGTGFAAMGAGKAISGVGNLIGGIAEGIGGLFGMEGGQEALIDNLVAFGELKLNHVNIKNNSEAMAAYGIAMTAGGAGKALGAIGVLTEGVFGGLGKLLGATPPVDSMIEFSKVVVDKEAIQNNSEAMMAYLGAVTLGTGASVMSAVGSLAGAASSMFDGVSKFFGGKGFLDTTIENLQKLSATTGIDKGKIVNIAEAMVAYLGVQTLGAGASTMGAVASLGTAAESFADGFSKMLGGKGQLDTQISC